MDINLKKINQLVTVARTGNFSRAAEELHISQPALSRSIAAFEEDFGIRVFDRGRSGAALTPLGELAIAEAEQLLKQASTLSHNLSLYGKGDAGKVALGMGPLVASIVLPSLSCDFLQRKPKMRIQSVVKPANILLGELMDDNIEMFYCSAEVLSDHEELAIEKVGVIDLSMIVHHSHPLAGRASINSSDVSAFPMLSGEELSSSATSEGIFICDNYHILRETVMATDSIWISSPQFVAKEIADGQLETIAVEGDARPHQTTVCEVRRAARTPSPASNAISEFVHTFFSKLVRTSR